ncbi:unnamed protein product, partial [Medioppia subpectinata]
MCDNMDDVLQELADISAEPPLKRQLCLKCGRPLPVCWCPHLPAVPIETKNRVVILQHPNEEKRCLRTAKILELSLSCGQCVVLRGKRFSTFKYPVLKEVIGDQTQDDSNSKRKTILVYPGMGSQPLSELSTEDSYNIILIDGTWSQTRSIYAQNSPILRRNGLALGGYLQTDDTSAAETTIVIYEKLTNPLIALCDFQLSFGAVSHHSKEFLIMNGLYTKPLTKRIQQKLSNKQDIKQLIR